MGEAAEDVAGGVLEQLEGHGQVVILEHSVIIVHQRQVRAWGTRKCVEI